MIKQTHAIILVVVIVVVIVSIDLLFFRDRFWERLIANTGIILAVLAFYLRFFK